MFRKLIARIGTRQDAAHGDDGTTRLDRMKAAYDEWQISQDIGAIMSALDRLSDRRLAMIGLRRDDLYDAVAEMMDQVQQQKRIGQEVLALLEPAPEDSAPVERPAAQSERQVTQPDREPVASRIEEREAA